MAIELSGPPGGNLPRGQVASGDQVRRKKLEVVEALRVSSVESEKVEVGGCQRQPKALLDQRT